MVWSLYTPPPRKSSKYSNIFGSQSWFMCDGEDINFYPYRELNLSGCTRSQSLHWLSYSYILVNWFEWYLWSTNIQHYNFLWNDGSGLLQLCVPKMLWNICLIKFRNFCVKQLQQGGEKLLYIVLINGAVVSWFLFILWQEKSSKAKTYTGCSDFESARRLKLLHTNEVVRIWK